MSSGGWRADNLGGIVFDSSVYIDLLRGGDPRAVLQLRTVQDKPGEATTLYLSSVVLEELYAGAIDPKAKKLILRLEKDFGKIERLITPTHNDWSLSGQILCSIGQKCGFEMVKLSRMTNDCLIAMSALRNGLKIITRNAKDFRIISSFRQFDFAEI